MSCRKIRFWSIEIDKLIFFSYAQLLMVQEKFDDAKVCLTQAYDVHCQIHGKNNPEVATLLNNLAVVCTNVCNAHSLSLK